MESIKNKLKLIDDKVTKLEQGQQNMQKALAGLDRPAKKNPPKKEPPKTDPNKVYNIAIGNSIIEGNPNAPVTIIEWMDYQ